MWISQVAWSGDELTKTENFKINVVRVKLVELEITHTSCANISSNLQSIVSFPGDPSPIFFFTKQTFFFEIEVISTQRYPHLEDKDFHDFEKFTKKKTF